MKDAGRKKVINDRSWAENRRHVRTTPAGGCEAASPDRIRKTDRAKNIAEVQKFVRKHRPSDQRVIDAQWATHGLKDMIQGRPDITKPLSRVVSLKIRRVATRDEICAKVSDLCMRVGRRQITPNQVREAWYRIVPFCAQP